MWTLIKCIMAGKMGKLIVDLYSLFGNKVRQNTRHLSLSPSKVRMDLVPSIAINYLKTRSDPDGGKVVYVVLSLPNILNGAIMEGCPCTLVSLKKQCID